MDGYYFGAPGTDVMFAASDSIDNGPLAPFCAEAELAVGSPPVLSLPTEPPIPDMPSPAIAFIEPLSLKSSAVGSKDIGRHTAIAGSRTPDRTLFDLDRLLVALEPVGDVLERALGSVSP